MMLYSFVKSMLDFYAELHIFVTVNVSEAVLNS
jgi:hypothetical protein